MEHLGNGLPRRILSIEVWFRCPSLQQLPSGERSHISPNGKREIIDPKVQLRTVGGYVIVPRNESGQIIATSHDLTPNGGLVREIPLFHGNLGW